MITAITLEASLYLRYGLRGRIDLVTQLGQRLLQVLDLVRLVLLDLPAKAPQSEVILVLTSLKTRGGKPD